MIELVSVCCISDATHYGSRPTFEGEEMMHHCGYERNTLANAASLDATHHGGRPTFKMRETLHHYGLGGRVGECCITGCNAPRMRAHFQGRRDVASLWATKGMH